MWKLLHVMTIYGPGRSKDFSKPAEYASMMSDFITVHFPCVGCRKDFMERIGLTKSDLPRRDPTRIKTNNDLIIWLWKLHNDVNRSLIEDPGLDNMQFGDVKDHPKKIWPDKTTSESYIVDILKKEYRI